MANLKGNPKLFQGRSGIQKLGELPHGILLAAVGVSKVGEHSLRLQAGQRAQPGDLPGGLFSLPKETQAAHAGVQLHVDGEGLSCRHRCIRESLSSGQVPHRLGHLVLQQHGGQLHGGVAQAQDGQGDPRLTQLPGLVHAGHGQHVGPQLLQLLGHLHRPMAIGVGLAHAQKPAARRQHGAQSPVVMFQGGQVDLRPGSHLCGVHL